MKESDGLGQIALDEATVAAVNLALHESQVSGFRVPDDGSMAELLVLIDTLPEAGPMEQARRVVVMHDPSLIRILLRRTGKGHDFYEGPMLELHDVAELERFFARHITWADAMYSCDFLDGSASQVADWPIPVSLELAFEAGRDDHSLYWWVECAGTPTTTCVRTGSRASSSSAPWRCTTSTADEFRSRTSGMGPDAGGARSTTATLGSTSQRSERRTSQKDGSGGKRPAPASRFQQASGPIAQPRARATEPIAIPMRPFTPCQGPGRRLSK